MAEQSVVRLFPEEEPDEAAPEAVGENLRALEAVLFASAEPVGEDELKSRLPADADIPALLAELEDAYARRGVNLVRVAKGWAFRTAPDLASLMTREIVEQRRLSRAALEMLAIIAYHQPVTRSEIEEIRGVATSKGTLDLLMELGWVRISGRRQVPGRPVTFSTTDAFLEQFSLDRIGDLPGVEELSAAGLLDKNAPLQSAEHAGDEADEDDPADDEELDRLYMNGEQSPDDDPET
jgi:segregation and condensation protein B